MSCTYPTKEDLAAEVRELRAELVLALRELAHAQRDLDIAASAHKVTLRELAAAQAELMDLRRLYDVLSGARKVAVAEGRAEKNTQELPHIAAEKQREL